MTRPLPGANGRRRVVTEPALEVRRIELDEFERFAWTNHTAFGEQFEKDRIDTYRQTVELDRCFAAFEGDLMVGTLAVLSMELTLPGGGRLPMGGISWVGVLPPHRRRGALTRLMQAATADSRSRDEPLSGLNASEATIYGRFGYGPATLHAGYEMDTLRARLLEPGQDQPGSLRQLPCSDAERVVPGIYDRFGRGRTGALLRSPGWWSDCFSDPPHDRGEGGPLSTLVHYDDGGEPDGYAIFRIQTSWKQWLPESRLKLVELVAADPGTQALLWRSLFAMDLVRDMEIKQAPVDDPLRWLLVDPRQLRLKYLADDLWLRVLDVTRALGARTYRLPGRLVLELEDRHLSENTGRFMVDVAEGGRAAVSRTDEPADISLDASTLGATYLGGVSFELLRLSGRLRQLTPGACRRADLMFLEDPRPFAGTMF
jgi:predicted acetyltransferase